MSIMTSHARDRALERYDMTFSEADARVILDACRDGRAPMLRKNHAGSVHIFTFKGRALNVVIESAGERIISFLPPNYFTKGQSLEHWGSIHPIKTTPKGPSFGPKREERRQNNRSVIHASMEDGE